MASRHCRISDRASILGEKLDTAIDWKAGKGGGTTIQRQHSWNKSLKSFPPCYLQSPVLTNFTLPLTHWDRYPRVSADRENWNWAERRRKDTNQESVRLLSRVAFWGGHKSAHVSHKHMLFHPPFSPPLINEDLPAGPQLVFTLNNRFFRHHACYSLLPAKPGRQADRVISLCKYKVVALTVWAKVV